MKKINNIIDILHFPVNSLKLARDGVCNPVTNVLVAIEAFKRSDRSRKPRSAPFYQPNCSLFSSKNQRCHIIWYKIRKDGGPDRRGVGFYFRNVTEIILFGVRGKNARTLQPGRTQENIISSRKREHSRKPDEQYDLIEACSSGPRIELFARGPRKGWFVWGNQSEEYTPDWDTYSNHSQSTVVPFQKIAKAL